MQEDIMHRFHKAIPQIREWIDNILNTNAEQAHAVGNLNFTKLSVYFPRELLDYAKVVIVDRVPFPPIDKFGLPELAFMQQKVFQGITYKDTFFLQQKNHKNESLHFHELVHVVQWSRLGVNNFLLAYGFGLYKDGYDDSPLEKMAYEIEKHFVRGTLRPHGLVSIIENVTDNIWNDVAAEIQES